MHFFSDIMSKKIRKILNARHYTRRSCDNALNPTRESAIPPNRVVHIESGNLIDLTFSITTLGNMVVQSGWSMQCVHGDCAIALPY